MDDRIEGYGRVDVMTANKFHREYAQTKADVMADAAQELRNRDQASEERAVMRAALSEAWAIFDMLGSHQSDDDRLLVLHSPNFESAAYRVRTAMLKLAR